MICRFSDQPNRIRLLSLTVASGPYMAFVYGPASRPNEPGCSYLLFKGLPASCSDEFLRKGGFTGRDMFPGSSSRAHSNFGHLMVGKMPC